MSPFDHVNAIYTNQSIDYFDNLDDSDKKGFSSYMINRIISMIPEFLPIVNEFQQYLNVVSPRETYLFYSQLLPKGKRFGKYIKGEKESKIDTWIVDLICKYFQISKADAIYYIMLMCKTDEGKADLKCILAKFGIEPNKLKKLKLNYG